jgi:Xaa-Pro aminopeptidase
MGTRFTGTVWLAILIFATQARGASDNSFYAARRQAVMKQIEGGVAVLQGAPETRAYEQFRQANEFYYLTGVEAPGALLLLDGSEQRSVLFLPPRNPHLEAWEGPRMVPGERAQAASGIDQVFEIEKFESELQKRKGRMKVLYTPFSPAETAMMSRDRAMIHDSAQHRNPWDGRVIREKAFQERLSQKLGTTVEIKDLTPVLDAMRRIKDELEIGRLRKAGHIGSIGHAEAMRSAEPGQYEYQIAAVADFVFRWHGATGPGYFPIAGSGSNSCILHYSANSRQTQPGDLFVLDFGPEYQYYQSDITRTFPVSGKFTEEQARVYRVVLEAQKAALAKVRPGATFADINRAAREVITRHGYGKYWRHGVSHYVGMSTHDVGGSEALEPGVVLTVEPGIYIEEKALGIRIEDTVLVTADGCEIFSRDVPKEIDEIENLMARKGIGPTP